MAQQHHRVRQQAIEPARIARQKIDRHGEQQHGEGPRGKAPLPGGQEVPEHGLSWRVPARWSPLRGTWPVGAPFTNPYYYPDPFPRNYYGSADPNYTVDYIGDTNPFDQGKNGGWVGAYFDADGDQVDDSADNIYSVRPL